MLFSFINYSNGVYNNFAHEKKKANKTIDAEEEYKINMRLVIRIIIAIIISVIISIITFYVLGIAVIGFLRQGH